MIIEALLTCLSVLSLPADTVSLRGTITDANGNPLPGATVMIQGTSRGTTTDTNGDFRLIGKGGQRTFQIRYTGFTPVDTSLYWRPGTRPLHISMKENSFGMDEVVVTGTRTPKALTDSPVITRVITASEIHKDSPQSLMDVLETELPGIEFTRTEGVTNSVTFQGLSANYLLFLVDGERMAGETSRSNPDFNRIDIDNVERIEVVKGGMSTLYGSGAVAGVINIITQSANKPFQARVNAQYDTEGEQKYGLNIGTKKGRFTSFTSGLARFKSAYMMHDSKLLQHYYDDGRVAASDSTLSEIEIEGYKNFTIEEKLGYRFSNKLNALLKASYYNHERYNAGLEGTLKHDIYHDWNTVAKMQYDITAKSRFELTYNYDDYNKYYKYFKLNETDLNYKNILHHPKLLFITDFIPSNTVVAGIETFSEKLQTYQFSDSTHHVTRAAAYLQDDYTINNHFSLQAGLRMDHHSKYDNVNLNPKLSAMLKTSGWNFRAGYAAGFRAPTLKELYTAWDHQGMFKLIGNPNLKPEKSHNLSASVEYTKGVFNASVNSYYNHIYNKISTVWNAKQDTSFYNNIDKATVSGIDFNLRVRLFNHWTLKGGYAYVRDRQMVDGYNTSSTRPHSANIRLEYNFKVNKMFFSAGLNGRYLGKLKVYSEDSKGDYYAVRYPAYSLWKLNLTGQFSHGIRANLGVNNLFNYKPDNVTYNAGITRGMTIFAAVSVAIEELTKQL